VELNFLKNCGPKTLLWVNANWMHQITNALDERRAGSGKLLYYALADRTFGKVMLHSLRASGRAMNHTKAIVQERCISVGAFDTRFSQLGWTIRLRRSIMLDANSHSLPETSWNEKWKSWSWWGWLNIDIQLFSPFSVFARHHKNSRNPFPAARSSHTVAK
jgi:hypothetical protein